MLDDALPNLLIGLREGLEAGLVVSILVATLVRSEQRHRLGAVWTGVVSAIAVSLAVGAVLTFAAASMPARTQEIFSGLLSVIAVGFVTLMVFWMRRSARTLSGDIRSKVTDALRMGPAVLVVTSFLAVAREGLETSLFLWSSTRTAAEATGPLLGGLVGLLVAAGLCWGLYRRVLRINLTSFFTVTGIALIVVAAGVFGYALRDLQEGGALPGSELMAFDIGAVLHPGSWYQRLIEGTLNITPEMTVLQVSGYLAYLLPVLALFLRGVRAGRPSPRPQPITEQPITEQPVRSRRRIPRWAGLTLILLVPALVAVTLIRVLGPRDTATALTIEITDAACAPNWPAPAVGRQLFEIHNGSTHTAEIYLLDPASSAVYGEIEGLAPGATRALAATVGAGSYAWRCVLEGAASLTSPAHTVIGGAPAPAVVPVSEGDLSGPVSSYRATIAAGLTDLVAKTRSLQRAVVAGNVPVAKSAWLAAHLAYASLGAAYGTFGDFDGKINGRPDGLPGRQSDPDFTGFLRVEYGLWHGEPTATLEPAVDQLTADVQALRAAFGKQTTDPGDLALRSHEILENSLQFELTGDTDQGSGSNLATTWANLAGTRSVLATLRPMLQQRDPTLLSAIDIQLDAFGTLLVRHRSPSGAWQSVQSLSTTERQQLDGRLGMLLETLARVPTTLEIRKAK